MKMNKIALSSAIVAGYAFLSSNALAQADAPAPAEAPAAPAVEAAPAAEETPAPAAEEVPAPAAEETPAPAAEEEPAPAEQETPEEDDVAPAEESETADVAEEETEEAVADEDAGGASIFVFADAWAGWQSARSGTGRGGGVYANTNVDGDGSAESGFGLNWLGTDLAYDGGMWAVNGSLRFGDGVAIYGTDDLGPITNAYATYRPTEGLSLDLGVFGTIYGAEVAESWQNLNYTRGELYFNMQPFWHTGLRAEYVTGDLVFRGLVVNDANSSNLGAGALNAGVQVGWDNGTYGILGGVLQSLKPDTTVNNGGFVDTFIDVVATYGVGDFSLIGNFDMNVGYEADQFWGASLAAGYQLTPAFGVAVRGEFLSTPDGFLYGNNFDPDDNENLVTGTLTLDLKPLPSHENFVVRWDNRIEGASEEVYTTNNPNNDTSLWFSSTVGVVAYADLL